jgi:hypothetical protein
VKGWLRDYALSVALAALFLVSWALHGITSWMHYVSTQEMHQHPVQGIDFLWQFGNETFENWQSEFLQLLTMVVLTAYLRHKRSGEGKQNQEQIDRIERTTHAALSELRRVRLYVSRLETLLHNRTVAAPQADHDFVPVEDSRRCGVEGCDLSRSQHWRVFEVAGALERERIQADHPFVPFYDGGNVGHPNVCGVRDCRLSMEQHAFNRENQEPS